MLSDRISRLFSRIDEGKRLIDQYRPLSNSIVSHLRDRFLVEWTYNSNAIEGNTLTLKETRMVLEDGITIGKKPLKDHLEAINHKEAIVFIEELASQKDPITERNIREIHAISNHLPPDPLIVPELMANFTNERLLNPTGHPIEQAARAHFDLVSIHPFVDGNGRTARLIMNLILLKHGYFPTIILKNDRKKYYDALEKGRQKNNVDDFIFLTGRALERTIYLYLEVIPEIKTHFLTLSEAAKLSPYSQDYLGILARRGSIPAFKLKRNWVITQEALQRYVHDQKNQK